MRRMLWLGAVALLLMMLVGWRLAFPPMPTLARHQAGNGAVTVQVTRFEWASRRVAWVDPPSSFDRWVAARSEWLGRLLTRMRTGSEPVPEGTVLLHVEADLTGPLAVTDLTAVQFRVDYGDYTIGSNGHQWTSGVPVKQIATELELTRGDQPVALEINVGGTWYRFPVR